MPRPLQPPYSCSSRFRRWLVVAVRTIIFVFVIVTASAVILAERGCTNWIAHGIVDAPNAPNAINPADDPSTDQLKALQITRQLRVDVGPPDASLSLWIIDPPGSPANSTSGEPKATILVLHGIRDRKDSQIYLGRDLAEAGYRAVLVDLRGHGRSSGQWLTYGVVEARDLVQTLDALQTRQLLVEPIGLIGTSYGGSVGIQLAAIDDRIKAIIAIAPFAGVRELLPCYAEQIGINGAISGSQMDAGFAKAGILAHCDLAQADPLAAISKAKAHVLLIHGRDDANIPCDHSERLAKAAGDQIHPSEKFTHAAEHHTEERRVMLFRRAGQLHPVAFADFGLLRLGYRLEPCHASALRGAERYANSGKVLRTMPTKSFTWLIDSSMSFFSPASIWISITFSQPAEPSTQGTPTK